MSKDVLNVISLGAGVQSSTMALMAECGEIQPKPDCAIFADTQAEPRAVYEWLDWLEKQLSFPVYRVSEGDLGIESVKVKISKLTNNKYTNRNIPAYTLSPDGTKGIKQRQCTFDFKIVPIKRMVRKLLKESKLKKTLMWIGISRDEIRRMKPSRVGYIENIFPLIDKGVSREDCLNWMNKMGHPKPARSSCIFCPFRSNKEWKMLTDDEMKEAIIYERKLQEAFSQVEKMNSIPYLHNSRVNLDKVVFDTDQLDLFTNECEGMCGV